MSDNLYINFGCGRNTGDSFLNFDASPTVYLQRMFLLGPVFRLFNAPFPSNVKYGDIVGGLPISPGSCKGIFSSHVLEHLSYDDCQKALRNCYNYLAPGGTFRSVLPNFEAAVRFYQDEKQKGNVNACNEFLTYTFLGRKERPKSLMKFIASYFSGSDHLWMWDFESLSHELQRAGFRNIRRGYFNDSTDKVFREVEIASRFEFDALCVEATR